MNMLVIAAVLSLLGLALWLSPLWPWRRFWAYGLLILDAVAAVVYGFGAPGWLTVLFASVVIYKWVNAGRLIADRVQPLYLRQVSRRAALLLSLLQVVLCLLAPLLSSIIVLVYVAILYQLGLALLLLVSTARHLQTTKTLQVTKAYTDAQLPSLSVLIPARNETDDLYNCLHDLIASDYPKLEIIVLDDNSQNRRTPEIIRSFAHDGVRFIAGKTPNDSWLAKNYAYQQLADAASGDYLLFCGVDLRVTPGALRELITTMLEKNKTMLSILPQNSRPSDFRSYLIQPLRYAWELSLPRRLFQRPPVLSTCWIITREVLLHSGSFKAVSRSILPESHFARATARLDGYSFLRSNLLISSKPAIEQRATAVRMRYPQLHRRLEWVWLLTAIELLGIVLPLPLGIALLLAGHPGMAVTAVAAFIIDYVVYLQVTGIMYGRAVLWGGLLAVLAAFYDVLVLNESMYRYEFSTVIWKERNISTPIMRLDEPSAPSVLPPTPASSES